MNNKAIKWLYQELPKLIAKGILTQEIADKIQEYYGEMKSASKTWVALIICGVAGALLIGLGIILILAHNWEQFSQLTRTILSLTPLIIGQVLALWVLCKRPNSSAFKEGTATFLSLMVGASIALISQTYNIPGDTGTFILTWMLLILPLVYIMQASLPAAFFIIGITAWSGSHYNNPTMAILFWPLAAVIMPHFIWSLRQEIYTIRATILSLAMAVCVSIAAGFSLGKAWLGSWIIVYSSIYAIFYYIGNYKFKGITTNWQRPLHLIGAVATIVLAFQFTFRYAWEYMNSTYRLSANMPESSSVLLDPIITLAIVALAVLFFYGNVKRKNLTASLYGVFPVLAFVSYLFKGQVVILPLLIFNLYLFVLSISRIMIGIRKNSLGAVNIGMLILAILILTRFFDSNINFILKGLAFIAVGIGFLATNVVISRRKGGAQ